MKRHLSALSVASIGLAVLGLGFGIQVIQDQIRQAARAQFEEMSEEIRLRALRGSVQGTGVQASEFDEISYNLINGWNLIAFPLTPATVKTASDLMVSVAQQNGYVTTVAAWDKDQWVEFSQRGAHSFGFDFDLVPGNAYFVKNHQATTWKVQGQMLDMSQREIPLHDGWNAVALDAQTLQSAEAVLDDLNQSNPDRATEVNRWLSGNWDPFVKRTYSAEDIQTYGTNFSIDPEAGYFVRIHGE